MLTEEIIREELKSLELLYLPLTIHNIKRTEQYLVHKFNIPYLYFFIEPTTPNPKELPFLKYQEGYLINNKHIIKNNIKDNVNLLYKNSFRLDCYLDSINFYNNQFKSPLNLRFRIDKDSLNNKFKIEFVRRQVRIIEDGEVRRIG